MSYMKKLEKVELNDSSFIRNIENSKYFGYLVYISYDGSEFESFDDNPKLKSVKGVFKKILDILNIHIVKGIQQAGRTDKYVSGDNNILYFNSKIILDCDKIVKQMNDIILNDDNFKGIKINKILRTIPVSDFPSEIKSRKYVYSYPKYLIKNNEEKINEKIKEVIGTHNFIDFTSKKGKKLLELERTVYIDYNDGNLIFTGNKFLPQQVRIMSNYILNNKKSPIEAKYLTFINAELSGKMEKFIFYNVDIENIKYNYEINNEITFENIEFIEKNSILYIFYVKPEHKGKVIGKNGKNIRKIKKILGDIVIKEVK